MTVAIRPASDTFTPRQQAVLTAALDLLVEAGDGLTMTAVARRASCSKETLYKWFGDRDGLLTATVQWQAAKVRVPLVERQGRGLRLTGPGRAYAGYARQILGLHDEALAVARSGQDAERGQVRVAAVTTAGEHLLPSVLASFLGAHPGVDLRLEVGSSERMWAMFAAHEADLMIGGRPPPSWPFRSGGCR